ncbi:uncharacterized protein [Chelonus insularis]|uniref:uncharacterized protein n=1 Tax=Chelonus insularis TaxID=460826 RepID=UPI00158EFFD3|nr:uncharacterized protein LOC118070756 [Chelonus insularis]XP_034945443.1 uncharacterized protein LOC118070756 [Chelonus insularis]
MTNCTNLESQKIIKYSDEEDNLLPSKKQGKSEIILSPIKRERKSCGHCEPCENIVCDINIHQYIDHEGLSMLAVNIDESEITAAVSKHCENPLCDSLSIEHDRCRRAVIYLYRCDKSNICDICKTSLKTRKARVYHRNCKRKDKYQHNRVNGAQILREKMKERELQLMEIIRTKRNDYSDPLTGHAKAIEVLKKNSELIVIPKIILSMPPCRKLDDTVTNTLLNSAVQNVDNSSKVSNGLTTKLNSHLQKISLDIESHTSNFNPSKTTKENHDNNYSIVTAMPQTSVVYPLVLKDLVITPTLKSSILQPQNPYLMPVKVIPIKNLKSQPSLRHHTQGIPKFCIVPDNSVSASSFVKIHNITSTQNEKRLAVKHPAGESEIPQKNSINILTSTNIHKTQRESFDNGEKLKPPAEEISSQKYFDNHKKQIENKIFECSYCSKRFLTDWYFKLHVTKHRNEIIVRCQNCDMTFSNNCDLKRHVNIEHNDIKFHIKKNNETSDKVDDSKCNGISCNIDGQLVESNNEKKAQNCLSFKKSTRLRKFKDKNVFSSKINKIQKKKKISMQ